MGLKSSLFDCLFQRQVNTRVQNALRGHRALGYLNRSYSQEGEDLVLARYFEGQKSGFFVDIGAHHPFRFSNTYHFYLKGWRGINVDAMPGTMDLFRAERPEDINIEAGVGAGEESLRYHIFNESALNTFDPEHVAKFEALDAYQVEKIVEVEMRSLRDILEKNLTGSKEIDFLSVDVEGLDLEVLRSNDWKIFRPKVVIFEESPAPGVPAEIGGETCQFLESNGYKFLAKGIRSIFYERREP